MTAAEFAYFRQAGTNVLIEYTVASMKIPTIILVFGMGTLFACNVDTEPTQEGKASASFLRDGCMWSFKHPYWGGGGGVPIRFGVSIIVKRLTRLEGGILSSNLKWSWYAGGYGEIWDGDPHYESENLQARSLDGDIYLQAENTTEVVGWKRTNVKAGDVVTTYLANTKCGNANECLNPFPAEAVTATVKMADFDVSFEGKTYSRCVRYENSMIIDNMNAQYDLRVSQAIEMGKTFAYPREAFTSLAYDTICDDIGFYEYRGFTLKSFSCPDEE